MSDSEKLIEELCSSVSPRIENTLDQFSADVLEKLLTELSTISSILFKPKSDRNTSYVQRQYVVRGKQMDELKDIAKTEIAKTMNDDVLLDFDDDDDESNPQISGNNNALDDLDELFDFGSVPSNSANVDQGMKNLNIQTQPAKKTSNTQDLLDLF